MCISPPSKQSTPHSDDDDDDDEDYHKEDPCDLLMTHIAPQAHTLIFGHHDNMGCIQQASEAAAKRRHPILSIYIVSSNPNAERKLIFMFRHVPVRMYKLQNYDFFTPTQGLYPTMGVDRVAVLFAAKRTFGNHPVLAIDGGTAMTYAALDANGYILGGGIAPGIKVRLQSLHEHTGALPLIDHKHFQTAIQRSVQQNKPLSVFAKDTKLAMMATICSELAGNLRNVVKQFLSLLASNGGIDENDNSNYDQKNMSPNSDVYVVITGGDGDLFRLLLQKDTCGIIPVEPGVEPIPNRVKMVYSKNFAHYGISELLYQKCIERPVDPEEELRNKMVGLRVALSSKTEVTGISRATVLSVDSDPPTNNNPFNLASYSFLIRHDTTAKQQMLSLETFFGKYQEKILPSYLKPFIPLTFARTMLL
jgi:pantothenate kinase type III